MCVQAPWPTHVCFFLESMAGHVFFLGYSCTIVVLFFITKDCPCCVLCKSMLELDKLGLCVTGRPQTPAFFKLQATCSSCERNTETMCARAQVHVHACMHMHTETMCTWAQVHVHACMHMHMHAHAHGHTMST